MKLPLDRRRHAFRPDLADARLKGYVSAEAFADGTAYYITAPVAPVLAEPQSDASLDTEALWGEAVHIFEQNGAYCWGQLASDGYVGYIPETALTEGPPNNDQPMTHRVKALSTLAYVAPQATARTSTELPFGAELNATPHDAQWLSLSNGNFVLQKHIERIETITYDIAGTALRFLDVPYKFGGKSAQGIDCSGLVQLALHAAKTICPRDTDMQQADLRGDIELTNPDTLPTLKRGDLVYWPRHVGIMIDETHIVHASGTPMCVCVEPVGDVAARSRGDGPIASTVKRVVLQ